MHEYGEIRADCGNRKDTALGRLWRINGGRLRESMPAIDDAEFQQINRIVLALTPISYKTVINHYVKRLGRPIDAWVKRKECIGRNKRAYERLLRNAKQEFILKGGIN